MTYKNLQKFIKENNKENDFDLTSFNVRSKIIFAVGEHASNVACMLSSIMHACEITHSRYINIDYFELRYRFIHIGKPISIDELCTNAEKTKRISKGTISGDDLLFTLSLSLLDSEYIIIEMGEEYYKSVINRINFSPFAILFCSLDDEKNTELIKIAPSTTHICALSQKENYDYIRSANDYGRKTLLVSNNKIIFKSANLLGAEFYHFSYLYRASIIDQNNLLPTVLAIETASALFEAPRPYIYKGISTASLPHDLKIFSISPTILLRIGDDKFTLPRGFDFEKITNVVPSQKPTSNTIFYGNAEYIEKVKKAIR